MISKSSRVKSVATMGLLGAVSFTALMAAPHTFAQTAGAATAAANSEALGEVVVTARKTAENIQSVPLTITAVTKTELQQAGVQDLRDLTFLTPGLVYEDSGAQFLTKPTIRGQTDIGGTPACLPRSSSPNASSRCPIRRRANHARSKPAC